MRRRWQPTAASDRGALRRGDDQTSRLTPRRQYSGGGAVGERCRFAMGDSHLAAWSEYQHRRPVVTIPGPDRARRHRALDHLRLVGRTSGDRRTYQQPTVCCTTFGSSRRPGLEPGGPRPRERIASASWPRSVATDTGRPAVLIQLRDAAQCLSTLSGRGQRLSVAQSRVRHGLAEPPALPREDQSITATSSLCSRKEGPPDDEDCQRANYRS